MAQNLPKLSIKLGCIKPMQMTRASKTLSYITRRCLKNSKGRQRGAISFRHLGRIGVPQTVHAWTNPQAEPLMPRKLRVHPVCVVECHKLGMSI